MDNNQKFEISVHKLVKEYKQGDRVLPVLKEVTTHFESGKSYAITGVSGSGKSTFLQLLGGIDTPTSGTIHYGPTDIFSLKGSKRDAFFNQHIGFVFQFHYLIKELSVIQNVKLPGLVAGMSDKLATKRADELLDYCGLADKHDALPGTLSGGEQQRVAIARALFNKPAFLLADEPTGSLDATNVVRVVELFLRCQREWGMGLIICSHDEAVFEKMEVVYHLENGVLMCQK
jgi:lipoprotein-releasing system ATP-binding protein